MSGGPHFKSDRTAEAYISEDFEIPDGYDRNRILAGESVPKIYEIEIY